MELPTLDCALIKGMYAMAIVNPERTVKVVSLLTSIFRDTSWTTRRSVFRALRTCCCVVFVKRVQFWL